MRRNAAGAGGVTAPVVRQVRQSLRRVFQGVASVPAHLGLLRQGLAQLREDEAAFRQGLTARLLRLERQPPAAAAAWLAEWEALARARPEARRLELLRALFSRLAVAYAARTGTTDGPPPMPGSPLSIEIAPGELLDRLTILEIKLARITDPAKLANVRHEHALLAEVERRAVPASERLAALRADLMAANQALWDLEDRVRDHERAGDFGPGFVEVARSIYRSNDRRAAVKRQINDYLGSAIVEEKSYAPY